MANLEKQKLRNLFGFFPKVSDKKSATEACVLSGVSVLFIGFALGVFGLIAIMYLDQIGTYSYRLPAVLFCSSALLIIVAFFIRSGAFVFIPIVIPALLVIYAILLFTNLLGEIVAYDRFWKGIVVWCLRLFIPILIFALAINGLRGWIWLRKNYSPAKLN